MVSQQSIDKIALEIAIEVGPKDDTNNNTAASII